MHYVTIESLSKLFAVVANKQDEETGEKFELVFYAFLKSEIEPKYFDLYLETFRQNLFFYSSLKSEKKVSLNSVRIIRICEEIKEHLSREERLYVLFYLLQLINETGTEKQSLEFVELIADMFGFSNDFFSTLSEFQTSNFNQNISKLLIENVQIAELLFTDYNIIFIKPGDNKLKINGRSALPGKVYIVNKDSVAVYADTKKYFYPELFSLKFQDNVNDEFQLCIKDLELKKAKKTLVQKTSLTVKSGEFVGVIGKSGCGKTSFLKCLTGKEKKINGQILITDKIKNSINRKTCFVSQHDSFVPLYTVEEHLRHRCNFMQIISERQTEVIDNILNETDLTGEKNKKVCKTDNSPFQVSGGQQKRLSIAMELISDPDILLLDEPTSGLSSEDSYRIISLLKGLSAKNKIVIASIHQPDFDIFMMFDKILVIDEGGFPIYFGTPAESSDYLRQKAGRIDNNTLVESRYNPAVLLKLIEEKEYDEFGNPTQKRKISPQTFYHWFLDINRSPISCDSTINKKRIKQNPLLSFVNQLKFTFSVDLKNYSRLALLIAIPLFTGIVFSFLTRFSNSLDYTYYYNPNIPVWILIILTTSVFIGLVSSGHEFIQLKGFNNNENRIINKSLSLSFATIVKYLSFSIVQALLIVLPSVLIIQNSFHFSIMFIVSFCLIFWGSLVGLLLSSFCRNTGMVYLVIPLIVIPQLVFSGALINFGDFNKIIGDKNRVPVIADFVPMRWASEAVITDFYCSNPYFRDLYVPNQYLSNAIYYNDYFLPAIEDIASKDSLRMKTIIDNEEQNPGFVMLSKEKKYLISEYQNYYAREIDYWRNTLDSIYSESADITVSMTKYSNSAVNKVVNGFGKSHTLAVDKNIIQREYMPVYILPGTSDTDQLFLKNNKSLFGQALTTAWYNIIILAMFCCVIIIVVVVVNYIKRFLLKINA